MRERGGRGGEAARKHSHEIIKKGVYFMQEIL